MPSSSLRILAAILWITFNAVGATGQLLPRVPFSKPLPPLPSATVIDSVVVKFHEGTRIRLREGQFSILERSEKDESQLAVRKLDDKQVEIDLASFNEILSASPLVVGISRTFSVTETVLAIRRAAGETTSGAELADLDLYYRIELPEATTAGSAAALIDPINDLASIEVAYAASVPSLPGDIPPTTPDFFGQGLQGYLESAALGGVDARYSWTIPGGKGDGSKVVDVELTWKLTHEDFPATFYNSSGNTGNGTEHGDAVIGILAARDNGYGVTGIAHKASIGLQSVLGVNFPNNPNAINQAAIVAGAGGIVLVELQVGAGTPPGSFCPCPSGFPCNHTFVPVEFEPASFDSIHNATANGVIVVEAGANGSNDLDNPFYNGAFDRLIRDSGAILVGGGTGPPRVPICTSNFGSRMDVQGWARLITTLGFGDLFGGNDQNQAYTSQFGNTSGASPMVAGAAANIQGVARAHNLTIFSPLALRALLRSTGTPQAADSRQVGPLPNLRAAIDQVIDTVPTDNPPVARLSVTCSGLFCQANASASTDDHAGLTFSFRWEAGGAATPFSTLAFANHTYNVPGVIYPITVTAKDSAGQTATATVSSLVGGTTPGDTVGLAPSDGRISLRLYHEQGVGQGLGVEINGTSGLAISGDWNGDGVDTLGRYDQTTSTFALRNTNADGTPDVTFSFTGVGTTPGTLLIPLAGDWNGDGIATCGLYDPASGLFYLRNSNTSGGAELAFSINTVSEGSGSFLAIAGDWNGDGIDTVGFYQTSTSVFSLRDENSEGNPEHVFLFGTPELGLLPNAGDWDGDGWDSIGLWNPTTSEHLLRNLNSAGSPDHQFNFTLQKPNTVPLAGDWDGDF